VNVKPTGVQSTTGGFMSRVIYDGRIDGEFEGFDFEALFKLLNGSYWLQAEYKYWYHARNIGCRQDSWKKAKFSRPIRENP